jgi:hypothetical protein
MNNLFTISKNTQILNEKELNDYIKALEKYKPHIHDINVTCSMYPFTMDAHGVLLTKEEGKYHI